VLSEQQDNEQSPDEAPTAANLSAAAEEWLDEKLVDARLILDGLAGALKADSGAAFTEPFFGALAVVATRDPAAWARAKTTLQKAKVSVKEVEKALRKPYGAGLHVVQHGTTSRPPTARSLLGENCPAPDLVIPEGFSLRPEATTKMVPDRDPDGQGEREEVIAHAPVLIAARLRDIDVGTESLDLCFCRSDNWQHLIVDRAVALDTRKIVQLASNGFPVASTTAGYLVEYLNKLEGINFHRIPTIHSTSHLGWQGEAGEQGFLCGRKLILPGSDLVLPEDSQIIKNSPMVFVGSSQGDEQIVNSIYALGSMEGWLDAISVVVPFPRVLLGLYASLVPPLLRLLGAPNFIIDWWNRTSTGKTTVLRLAASVWGNPDEQAPDSFVQCWDATSVFIERACSVIAGLPLLLDETKRAKNPQLVGSILYDVAHGRGKGRGNVKGIERTGTWKTVLLSTGEGPATGFTQDGGTRARALEIPGHPFGRADEMTGKVVRNLNQELKANFGHAGPRFVQWLSDNRNCWADLVDCYRFAVEDYSKMLPADRSRIDVAVVTRLAQPAAALKVTAMVAHWALDLPWQPVDPLEVIWHEIVGNTGQATSDERALAQIVSWAHSRRETFCSSSASSGQAPAAGWSGRWDSGEAWRFIAFFPHILKKMLAEFGFDPEAVLAGWKDRGWLDVGNGRGFDKSMRVGGENPCMIVVRREAIESIEPES
jgi:putative DNA primase/helicase